MIERVTTRPASILDFPERIGTLEPGATADVSVLEVVSGNLELVDSTGATRVGRETLVPVATVKSRDVLRL